MAPKTQLDDEIQRETLRRLFYDDNLRFGRDRLYHYIQEHHPDLNLTRRQVGAWLMKQENWQVNLKPNRRRAISRSIVAAAKKVGYLQIDLKECPRPYRQGLRYLIVIVDVFSKYVHVAFIGNKRTETVAHEVRSMIEQSRNLRGAAHMQSDNGGEFSRSFTDMLQDLGITHTTSKANNPRSQGVVERFNGSITAHLARLSATGNTDYVTSIPRFVDQYNNTVHSRTGLTPAQLQALGEDTAASARMARSSNFSRKGLANIEDRFDVGDTVRFRLRNGRNLKSQAPYWSSRRYVVIKKIVPEAARQHQLTLYKIAYIDDHARQLRGRFNATELLLAEMDEDEEPQSAEESASEIESPITRSRTVSSRGRRRIEYGRSDLGFAYESGSSDSNQYYRNNNNSSTDYSDSEEEEDRRESDMETGHAELDDENDTETDSKDDDQQESDSESDDDNDDGDQDECDTESNNDDDDHTDSSDESSIESDNDRRVRENRQLRSQGRYTQRKFVYGGQGVGFA